MLISLSTNEGSKYLITTNNHIKLFHIDLLLAKNALVIPKLQNHMFIDYCSYVWLRRRKDVFGNPYSIRSKDKSRKKKYLRKYLVV